MNALLSKEVRLELPALGAALALAILPVWLFRKDGMISPAEMALYPFGLATLLLALSSFGREFSLGTFALNLVQPRARGQLWRTKISVLFCSMAAVFVAWALSCAARSAWEPLSGRAPASTRPEIIAVAVAMAVVACAGGLWTTLALRQVIAAFWFTASLPVVIAGGLDLLGAKPWVIYLVLGLYAAAGFYGAWRHFLRIQETAWTGGIVTLPWFRKAAAASPRSTRERRPWVALFWKELQLQQVALAGMAWLFLLHLGVVVLRKFWVSHGSGVVPVALEVFGGIWFIVPLIVAGASVAEERKLGTMQAQLCLPISTRGQCALKLLFALFAGGLLSAVLFCAAEGLSTVLLPGRNPMSWADARAFALIFLALSAIGFYASTLTRNIIQSLGAGVVALLAAFLLLQLTLGTLPLRVHWLWQGPLVLFICWPILTLTLVCLMFQNYRQGPEGRQFWRRNVLSIAGALVLSGALTASLYNRIWELVLPLEPAHGPARIAAAKPASLQAATATTPFEFEPFPRTPNLSAYGGSGLSTLLPDHRLWLDHLAFAPGRLLLDFGDSTGIRIGNQWVSLSGHQFVPGSNWVEAVVNFCDTAAIRSDGSLWVSEHPRQPADWTAGAPQPETPAPLVQFGTETNWRNVVYEHAYSVVLLKTDGTLWRLGPTHFNEKKPWPGLRSFTPERLGADTDFGRIMPASASIFAWKRNGEAWVLNPLVQAKPDRTERLAGLFRLPSFDHLVFQSLIGQGPFRPGPSHAGVRADGTLWVWSAVFAQRTNSAGLWTSLVQVGSETNWVAVAGDYRSLAAFKADGSLWRWSFGDDRFWPAKGPWPVLQGLPSPMGSHRDWVAVGGALGGIVSLSADGSLWYWWDRSNNFDPRDSAQPMLATPRRPVKIENIFDASRG